jgi:hypothetical protein
MIKSIWMKDLKFFFFTALKIKFLYFSELSRCVVWWLGTNVSEDRAASIFRVEFVETEAVLSTETSVSNHHTTT